MGYTRHKVTSHLLGCHLIQSEGYISVLWGPRCSVPPSVASWRALCTLRNVTYARPCDDNISPQLPHFLQGFAQDQPSCKAFPGHPFGSCFSHPSAPYPGSLPALFSPMVLNVPHTFTGDLLKEALKDPIKATGASHGHLGTGSRNSGLGVAGCRSTLLHSRPSQSTPTGTYPSVCVLARN